MSIHVTLCHSLQEFACNGTVVEHPEYGEVIQLQGDQREHIRTLLIKVGIATNEQIKVCLRRVSDLFHTVCPPACAAQFFYSSRK